MGSNNGTGQPYWFRCTKCRHTVRGGDGGWIGDVILTGRKRQARSWTGGARVTPIEREFICNSCGHTGWSRHLDLAIKAGDSKYASLDDDGHLEWPSYDKDSAPKCGICQIPMLTFRENCGGDCIWCMADCQPGCDDASENIYVAAHPRPDR